MLSGAAAGLAPLVMPSWYSVATSCTLAGEADSPPMGSIAIGGATSKQLLELECMVDRAQHKCVAIDNSSALHCFLSATVACAAGLVLDTS